MYFLGIPRERINQQGKYQYAIAKEWFKHAAIIFHEKFAVSYYKIVNELLFKLCDLLTIHYLIVSAIKKQAQYSGALHLCPYDKHFSTNTSLPAGRFRCSFWSSMQHYDSLYLYRLQQRREVQFENKKPRMGFNNNRGLVDTGFKPVSTNPKTWFLSPTEP